MNETLAVIIPVYNEEHVIEKVLNKWYNYFLQLDIAFIMHVYNDGSTDKTRHILDSFAACCSSVIVHHKKNSGHGPTILQGYRENYKTATWLFQCDSDDEMATESFIQLWNARKEYDFLLGRRISRKQPLSRSFISFVSRVIISLLYGKCVWDVNSPYRLMRSEKFAYIYEKCPADTFAPNIIISGFVCIKKLRYIEFPVMYTHRTTGDVSIKRFKLFKSAIVSFIQTICFRIHI